MASLLQQATQMQQQMADAQAELGEATVTGTAGNGLVEVTASGLGLVKAVRIAPEAADPQDTEMLGDLVVAAIQDATAKADALQQEKLGPLAQLGQGGGFGALGGGGSSPLGF